MKNPLKFIQEVKQETFRITWPTKKDTMMGAVMVFALASIAAIFFLILDQILRFLLNIVLTMLKDNEIHFSNSCVCIISKYLGL